jgi:hypothetical protein
MVTKSIFDADFETVKMMAKNFNPKQLDVMLTNSIFIAFFCLYRSYCCMDILRLFQRCWKQQENLRLDSHDDFWPNRIPVFTNFYTLKLNAQSTDIKINKRHLLFKGAQVWKFSSHGFFLFFHHKASMGRQATLGQKLKIQNFNI